MLPSYTVTGIHWNNVIKNVMAIQNHPESYQRNYLGYWKHLAEVGIFYFLRYVHFMIMWNTFLMKKVCCKMSMPVLSV